MSSIQALKSDYLPTQAFLEEQFTALVANPLFPCLGAKAAFNKHGYRVRAYDALGTRLAALGLTADLTDFLQSITPASEAYATFVAIFRSPRYVSEQHFEKLLWMQLQQLRGLDATEHAWDPSVSSDVQNPAFSFSHAGKALYVVGMHSRSSRVSRRFSWPALIFNPHEQFERLRHDGKWHRMQETIRKRDLELQGNTNPMLSDFGTESEARQYAGRVVETDWRPPFGFAQGNGPNLVTRCPFHH